MDSIARSPAAASRAALLRPSGWLLLLRLVLFCLVCGATLFSTHPGSMGQTLLWTYFAGTLLFLLSCRRWRQARWRRLARYTGGVQLLLEIAVEGTLVAATNAFASPYILLLLLTIVSASLQFRLVGTLLVATACCVAVSLAVFVGVTGSDAGWSAARHFSAVLELNDDLFYALFLYICAFYLAAFVSGYLAERLEVKDRALEGASRALELARLETDDILRHMQSGLLTLSSRGTVVYFNRTAEEILGLRESEVTGRPYEEVFGTRMPELARLLQGALNHDHTHVRTEIAVTTPAGRRLPVGISTSILGTPGEAIRGVIAIFQDLTDAKRLEERIRVTDRLAAVGELSASIAHEIRNPLATISGSVQMLRAQVEGDTEGQSLMELILKESARLNRIVADFLDFARIKQQACHRVDLVAVAEEVRALFTHHPARGATGEVALRVAGGGRPEAAASTEQVKQMLINLVQNALEAVSGGEGQGQVEIEIRSVPGAGTSDDAAVELTVVDDGPGVPSEIAAKIGQPFFSTKKQGTGLGLAIVQRLAMASRGSLRWSCDPAGGTRFTVRLPAYSPNLYQKEVLGLAEVAGQLGG